MHSVSIVIQYNRGSTLTKRCRYKSIRLVWHGSPPPYCGCSPIRPSISKRRRSYIDEMYLLICQLKSKVVSNDSSNGWIYLIRALLLLNFVDYLQMFHSKSSARDLVRIHFSWLSFCQEIVLTSNVSPTLLNSKLWSWEPLSNYYMDIITFNSQPGRA